MSARETLFALSFLVLLTLAEASAQPQRGTLTLIGPGGRTLPVASLEGEEQLSRLFHFTIDLSTTNSNAVPFDAFLGQPVTVSLALPGVPARHFNGIASRISQGETDGLTRYRVEIVPRFWLLTKASRSRAYQDLSVPEIVRRVLGERGIAFQSNLQGTYPPRDFVLQYRETDFDFLSRLMEEEGMFYFFQHGADGHTLVIADTPQGHPDVPGGPTVRFGSDAVTEWTKTQELRSGKHTLRDYHFTAPGEDFEVSAELPGTVSVGSVVHQLQTPLTRGLEIYDWPGEYAQRFDGLSPGTPAAILQEGSRTVGIRSQEEAAQAIVIQGQSVAASLTAGHKFTLERHVNANGPYVLTKVSHSARVSDQGNRQTSYSNTFTCIPTALPFRPARTTPRPVVAGPQTAVVTGPEGSEVYADSYGRVKVQFHWDREGRHDENSSTWIRVGTVHGGAGFALPRVGDEVIVGFLEGDPDQPIILGTVPNPVR
jgi:type VI secretion system secreted protein VgrG